MLQSCFKSMIEAFDIFYPTYFKIQNGRQTTGQKNGNNLIWIPECPNYKEITKNPSVGKI